MTQNIIKVFTTKLERGLQCMSKDRQKDCTPNILVNGYYFCGEVLYWQNLPIVKSEDAEYLLSLEETRKKIGTENM
eukprot:6838384-Ditylum_brightwellii.AAC.1